MYSCYLNCSKIFTRVVFIISIRTTIVHRNVLKLTIVLCQWLCVVIRLWSKFKMVWAVLIALKTVYIIIVNLQLVFQCKIAEKFYLTPLLDSLLCHTFQCLPYEISNCCSSCCCWRLILEYYVSTYCFSPHCIVQCSSCCTNAQTDFWFDKVLLLGLNEQHWQIFH